MNYAKSLEIAKTKWEAQKELARRSFIDFVTYTKPDYSVQWFHELLASYIHSFAIGDIRKLMVFMPPQHGKSELTSRRLPAYLLGLNPKLKIVGCSYSADLSRSFNRDVQRIIDSDDYRDIFPDTLLNSKNVSTDAKVAWLRNADIFEVVKYSGFYKSVGVGGSLTGTPADVGIIDDPVKDSIEADSITYRTRVWEWYDKVFSTRLHNKSRILLTMTRWHIDDLAGRILNSQDGKNWTILKLPAIKTEQSHHPLDYRAIGEALWEDRHSAEKIRNSTERTFEALYQQNPLPPKGGLVFPDVVIIDSMPSDLQKVGIGLDFGFTNDPTAAVMCGIHGNDLYLDQLIYQKGLLNSEIYKLLPKNSDIWADSADPKSIEELRRLGLIRCKGATKGKDSILAGISLLREYKIHITKRSFGGINEAANYVYKSDGYGNPTNEPIDDFNHFWDAVRYWALMSINKRKTHLA